ncbi:hypothetical protein AB1Y20_001051 [Prymnesium parvum]|uniref:Uncharacterized protein n=1 Tax=Prymnesium parvum TaxID=97485 RepID=A0AB34K7M3_PRYPA|mmetsp:Transcript_1286/g.3259  ORF Transcript_1286/g.3259 Transcript_1286/m.3259 type:complete len:457 (+) Transcript_1286:150-1520(+)
MYSLTSALLGDSSEFSLDMQEWAAQISAPPLNEIPTGLLDSSPVFADRRLDRLTFPPVYKPPKLGWPPRIRPSQPLPQPYVCPRRAADLMPSDTWRRVERWLSRTLDDLICIRDEGEGCKRSRPGVLVIGQSDLHPWARGVVWDFRNSPKVCATPLDFHAPLEHTLNVEYLTHRLRDYPNQQIVGFIAEGMRPWADVELQTVLVPHLLSLVKGFPSVVKEIKRMCAPELRWYSTHADFPFWPMYSLGEGCVPRKLEDRWRRCEEGGGPRKETFDQSGVRALSINEASRLAHAMRALLVLKRAAFLMQEPVYLFGDDVKDYFNHFLHAPEVLHLMNTVFLDADDLTEPAIYKQKKGALIFVHEKRMGFGLHPNSVIAQDFSEALNSMFREDVDRIEDPILEADTRPSAQGRRMPQAHPVVDSACSGTPYANVASSPAAERSDSPPYVRPSKRCSYAN